LAADGERHTPDVPDNPTKSVEGLSSWMVFAVSRKPAISRPTALHRFELCAEPDPP
jgi:hypothetical protein